MKNQTVRAITNRPPKDKESRLLCKRHPKAETHNIRTALGITLTVLVVTIIIMLILAGVTISLLNSAGILTNSEKAANQYEITDEQDVISVAFSTVFANSALTDRDITPAMLQQELDKTTRKTTVRTSSDTGKEKLFYVKFDKTKNEHSIDITNGKIDFVGPYSEATVDILKNGTITMVADDTKFTNRDVTVTITYALPEDKKGEKDKIVLEYALSGAPNTWTKYETPVVIPENMTIYARLRYLTETTEVPASLAITNIDKIPPTASISLNGGNAFTMPTTGNATLKATPTISDKGVSGICASTLQYVWTQSETEPTSGWASFTNKTVVSKTDINKSGNWYLWIKYNDNARNNAKTTPVVTRSEAFTLSENTDARNKITLTANRTDWVNQDVIVSVNYGANLTQSKNLACNGTNNTDYTVNGTTNVVVKTNGKTVTATAKDIMGNMITASLTVTNIDKVAPTVAYGTNGASNVTMPTTGNATIKTTATVSDTGGSGLYTSSFQYVWTQSTTTPTSGWTAFTNGSTITKNNVTTAGTWYLWTRYNDNARNNTGTAVVVSRSNAFVVTANTDAKNKITLTANRTDWVNQDVTVTVAYGANLTQSKTLACNGTNNTDYTVNGTTNVVVKTNGKTVTATAKDIMDNMITASLTIENIDKVAPTVAFGTNGGTFIKSTEGNTKIQTKVTVSDTGGSNIYTNSLKYIWSQSASAPNSGYTAFTNGSVIQKNNITATGTWYLYVQYNDNARNNTGTAVVTTRTNAFTISDSNLAIGDPTWNGTNATFKITGSQTGSKLQYKIGNGAWTDIANGGTTPNVPTGTTLYACLFDGINRKCISKTPILTYNVVYRANGGTGNNITDSSRNYGTTYQTRAANTFLRTGHTFTGWKCNNTNYAAGANYSNLTTTNGSTVYMDAQWSAITYTIAYNANGGTGTTTSSLHTYDTAKKLTANGFSRTGYGFNGWNTKADGSGMSYSDKQSVENLSSTNGETVTLYAQWKHVHTASCYHKHTGNSSVKGGCYAKEVLGAETTLYSSLRTVIMDVVILFRMMQSLH